MHNFFYLTTKLVKLKTTLNCLKGSINVRSIVTNRRINLNINGISVQNYVEHLQNEYKFLKELKNNELIQQQRILELQPVMDILQDRNALLDNITHLNGLLYDKDSEIKKLAEEEKQTVETKLKSIDDSLLEIILPSEKDDARNESVLEVNAGVGGQEAMLFAKELFEMYCNFAEYKNWNIEIAEYFATDIGGIRHASAFISGNKVFQYLKYEAGVHRVQRIPVTEKHGRVHTSTVSVLALPQPTEIEINIDNKDLKIETKRASGAGGQHVNTTDSAVRITHLPSGLAVECQIDRSQLKNKNLAMQRLRALLYQEKLQAQMNEIEATKKHQVKSNSRNEKIRTYNFSQDRITDHRLQGTNIHNIKSFLIGASQLEHLITKIHLNCRTEKLLTMVKSVEDQNKV